MGDTGQDDEAAVDRFLGLVEYPAEGGCPPESGLGGKSCGTGIRKRHTVRVSNEPDFSLALRGARSGRSWKPCEHESRGYEHV